MRISTFRFTYIIFLVFRSVIMIVTSLLLISALVSKNFVGIAFGAVAMEIAIHNMINKNVFARIKASFAYSGLIALIVIIYALYQTNSLLSYLYVTLTPFGIVVATIFVSSVAELMVRYHN